MEAVHKWIFDTLRADAVLQGIFAPREVLVFKKNAEPMSIPPYIVQESDTRNIPPWGIYESTLTVHIWAIGSRDGDLMTPIGNRVKALLDRRFLQKIEGAMSVRIRMNFELSVPEQGQRNSAPNTLERIRHLVQRYTVRWTDTAHIQAVLTREQNLS